MGKTCPLTCKLAKWLDWLSALGVWMLPPHQPWACKCRPPYLLVVCLFCSVLFANVGSVDGTQGLLLVQQALYQAISPDSSPCLPLEDSSPAEVPAFCMWSVSCRLEDHPQNSCSDMALELGSQKDSALLSKTGSFSRRCKHNASVSLFTAQPAAAPAHGTTP